MQPPAYRDRVLSAADQADSTVITTQARWLMHDWLFSKVAEEYALSSDWDNRWRTGGLEGEVIEEAHLDPKSIFAGVDRFAREREQRIASQRELLG
jgi:transketolase